MKLKDFKGYILLVFLIFILSTAVIASPQEAKPQLNMGAGMFTMPENTGENSNALSVFYYRPQGWTPEKPVVIAMHGVKRNAKEYRDGWKLSADKYNLLVICPELSEKKYPGVRYYNLGNITDSEDEKGNLQPRDKWIFSVVNHVFTEVRARFGATSNTFTLFGHSAGSQFVHRAIFFSGDLAAGRIISANAGWYTLPDFAIDFPYGLKNVPITKKDLAESFARPVTILLGESDVRANDKVLRHTSQADAQGLNRLARGENFYYTAEAKAKELGVPFNWKLVTVPGIGHDDAGMAAAAAKLIAEGQ